MDNLFTNSHNNSVVLKRRVVKRKLPTLLAAFLLLYFAEISAGTAGLGTATEYKEGKVGPVETRNRSCSSEQPQKPEPSCKPADGENAAEEPRIRISRIDTTGSVIASYTISAEQRVFPLSGSPAKLLNPDDIQVGLLETGYVLIYDNSTTSGNWYTPGVRTEVIDWGTSSGGTVSKFTFGYATTRQDPGNVTVMFYSGTDSSICPGNFLAGWVFSGLSGSPDGGAYAFIYDFVIPSGEEFDLPSGAFGYSYKFLNKDTGVYLAEGGTGNENVFWKKCRSTWFGGDPWAGFYMRLYAEGEVEPDIRIEPLVLDFNCADQNLGPLISRQNNGDNTAPAAKLIDAESIMQTFAAGKEKVNVIVNLLEPRQIKAMTNWRSKESLGVLQEEVAKRQERVLSALPKKEFKLGYRFKNQAGFSAELTRAGLKRLLSHPMVASIEPVRILHAHLNQGIPLMNALGYRSSYNGAGMAIAVCDTGIDYTHPMLGGGGFPNSKVIGGYDFGEDDADPMPVGEPHGTSCAGIAAGDDFNEVGDYIGGVAHNAKLYALKISPDNSGSASTAAMVAAWDWCITHQDDDPNNPIMVISTSFGGGRYFSSCDSGAPAMTTAADNAVAAGITVLASSGNDGWCDSMGWPACISSVISVGAVYDAALGTYYPCVDAASCATIYPTGGCSTGWYAIDDTAADMVTSYSNTAAFLDILAPSNKAYTTDIAGTGGYSTGDYTDSFGGTSAACPYAAGAVACLQSAAMDILGRYLTPAEVKENLIAMGDYITDGKIAISRPRVNLARAVDNLTFSGETFTVYNDGTGMLTVSSITLEAAGGWVSFGPAGPFTIGAGSYQNVYVEVDCNSCDVNDRLMVYSDDPNESPYPNGVFVNVAAWPCDLDNDCYVGISDLAILADYWLQSGIFDADFDGDGSVNFLDFAELGGNWR